MTEEKVTEIRESEGDSSYDSDCEEKSSIATNYSDNCHGDVSRTVSDTLGQEFEEYINYKDIEEQLPDYKLRVDFAKKLGYTEEQLKIALSKLGPSPSQNELLSELILLDSNQLTTVNEPTNNFKQNNNQLLRHIVIDGSNVAMSHGNNKIFSCHGIILAVDYFKTRGHKNITVFIPSYRKEHSEELSTEDKETLLNLEKEGILVYTPSRVVNNKRLVCYDDRFILKLTVEVDGIVVSNDNYRDLTIENLDFKRIVQERLLQYCFVNDRFMPPEDPLGRNGPSLSQFLSLSSLPNSPPPCPYGKKCTYGIKCKYYHETQQKSITETLRKQAAMKTQSVPITKSSFNSQANKLNQITRTKSVETTSFFNFSTNNPEINTHRKLQRQLSINPQGDPRINQWNELYSNSKINTTTTSAFNPFPGNPLLNQVWSPIDQINLEDEIIKVRNQRDRAESEKHEERELYEKEINEYKMKVVAMEAELEKLNEKLAEQNKK